jgi:RNA polymerase sigma factor (sigma-70 family)
MRRARVLSVLLSLTFIAAFVLCVMNDAPTTLPGVAMDSPLLLHAMRAAVAAALVIAVAVVVLRLWQGELPTKLSTTGAEWAAPLAAPARDVQDQLLTVEQESRAAVEELARRVDLLAAQLPPDRRHQTEKDVQAVTVRWDVALDEAVRKDVLADAIYRLPERERLVIALSVYEGLTDEEVAEQLGVSRAAVAQIRSRSLRKLRDYLGREPFPRLFFVSFEGQVSDDDRKALKRPGWKLYENAIGSTAAFREGEMPPVKWRQVVRVPAESGDEAMRLVCEALGREPDGLRVDEGQLPGT